MKLTKLSIHEKTEVPEDRELAIKYNETVASNLKEVLRDQPLLEELGLSYITIARIDDVPLPLNIQSEDVPNLRTLRAIADVAAHFVPVAPRLEKMDLHSWRFEIVSLIQALEGGADRIRELSVVMNALEVPIWKNLELLFIRFLNVEVLNIGTMCTSKEAEIPPPEFYFEAIASRVELLSSLRRIKIMYHDMVGRLAEPAELDVQLIGRMKQT
ncbi:hypothetical protein FRC00_010095, partial [Tulasnella sp. 408]